MNDKEVKGRWNKRFDVIAAPSITDTASTHTNYTPFPHVRQITLVASPQSTTPTPPPPPPLPSPPPPPLHPPHPLNYRHLHLHLCCMYTCPSAPVRLFIATNVHHHTRLYQRRRSPGPSHGRTPTKNDKERLGRDITQDTRRYRWMMRREEPMHDSKT
jgi:hypothetical protein